MYSSLLSVELILSHQENSAALQDLGPTISDFLGPDSNLSLHDACKIGSLKLLNWIWRVSFSDISSRSSSWSPTCFLQSNRHYYRWQFSESLEIATGQGDLTVVKWLLERFKDCEVAVEVVEAAAKNGHLEVLLILLETDVERMKTGHKVHWGGHSLSNAVENGHSDVVHWLCQYKISEFGEAQITNAITTALRVGNTKLAEFLLPPGKCILDYGQYCPHPDIIQWKLDCGYFRQDFFSAGVAIKNLVHSERLDLMQRIAEQQNPPPDDAEWTTDWRCAMVLACVYGNRDILQWLMEHPAGRWTLEGDDRLYCELVFSAAYKGSIQVMEYLFELGAVDKICDALLHAIREDHIDLVKWLIDHIPDSERIPDYCVLDEAARYGRLEMLQYFQEQDVSVVPEFSHSVRRVRSSSREKHMTQMFVPASDNYLKVHATLCRYRSQWLPTDPMDDAAANGHLEVVKWLHVHRSEGCTPAAMDCAAANGHLEVVKWLHNHRLEGCTSKAMDGAAENGHLDVIWWLYVNHFEGCTQKAIEGALSNGHLRVSAWLLSHLPFGRPLSVELWRRPDNLFEVLLFLYRHFSNSLSLSLVEYPKGILLDSSSKSSHKHIVAWLQVEFPVAFGAGEDEEW
ncbi:hypothetical protein L917_19202 [Phytophthora nicotianae]|uniref:Ankyrin repeat-containing domain n=2 Tax=Phytophthora nicotianae TaxID=4792 RepID=W2K561_PHYNI|nr:hypothetical protein L917_19202 [Phytophthora nicotianae]